MKLQEAVASVLRRLDDEDAVVWSNAEIALYIKDGYNKFCRETKCLFDIHVIENVPPVGNWSNDLERYLAEQTPGMGLTDRKLNFTASDERDATTGLSVGGSTEGPTPSTIDNSQMAWNARALNQLLSSLQAYWKLDETSGSRIDSASDYDLLEVGNATTAVTGVIGNAANLTLGGSLISAQPIPVVAGEGWTVTGWLKPGPDLHNTWFKMGGLLFQGVECIQFTDGGIQPNYIICYVSDIPGNLVGTATTLNAGVYNFIRVWYDPIDRKVRLRVDEGTLNISAGSFASPWSLPGGTGRGVGLGVGLSGDAPFMKGCWDEMAFFNRVLTDEEAAFLFAQNTYPFSPAENSGNQFDNFDIFSKVAEGHLPNSTVDVLRVTWDEYELVPEESADMRRLDMQYERRDGGDPRHYTMDKDGLFTIRLVPPALGDAVYPTINGSWGTMTQTSDTEITTVGSYGILREVEGAFPGMGIHGTPTQQHPATKNIAVEIIRLGRSLDSHAFEIPESYIKFVIFWAMHRALKSDGAGQDQKLAKHYADRFQMGINRMESRLRKTQKEHVLKMGNQGEHAIPFDMGEPMLPYPYGPKGRRI